jgi:hypothetical protein
MNPGFSTTRPRIDRGLNDSIDELSDYPPLDVAANRVLSIRNESNLPSSRRLGDIAAIISTVVYPNCVILYTNPLSIAAASLTVVAPSHIINLSLAPFLHHSVVQGQWQVYRSRQQPKTVDTEP